MTYFPDLSPYTYLCDTTDINDAEKLSATKIVNVGWLERKKPFPTGEAGWPDQTFLDLLALFEEEQYRVNCTRGWHFCDFCEGLREEFKQDWAKCFLEGKICHDEIRVLGSDGIIYAAPAMLRHYIVTHQYRPPEPFIQAVLHGPRPSSPAYDQNYRRFADI